MEWGIVRPMPRQEWKDQVLPDKISIDHRRIRLTVSEPDYIDLLLIARRWQCSIAEVVHVKIFEFLTECRVNTLEQEQDEELRAFCESESKSKSIESKCS